MSLASPSPHGPHGTPPSRTEPSSDLSSLRAPHHSQATESPFQTHHIHGNRLHVEYRTASLGDHEVLDTALIKVFPPFGSSSLANNRYVIRTDRLDRTTEQVLISFLHETANSSLPFDEQRFADTLARLEATGLRITPEHDRFGIRRTNIPSMTYALPNLDRLSHHLTTSQSTFIASRVANGAYHVCECSIDPVANLLQARFISMTGRFTPDNIQTVNVSRTIPQNLSDKDRLQRSWNRLLETTQQVMRQFRDYGPECAIAMLKNNLDTGRPPQADSLPASLDDRLRMGVLSSYGYHKSITLPHGGQITLEVGDEVAALSVTATEYDGCSTYTAVFDSEQSANLATMWDSHIHSLEAMMDELSGNNEQTRNNALSCVHALATKVFERRCSLFHLLGHGGQSLMNTLSQFGGVTAWLPNNCSGTPRTDLLRGIERVVLSAKDMPDTPPALSVCDTAELEIRSDGSLGILVRNQLNNNLHASLSSDAVQSAGGLAAVATTLAIALSARNGQEGRLKVHQFLEALVGKHREDSGVSSKNQKNSYAFPPPLTTEQRAYERAAAVAELAHAFSFGYGDHSVSYLEDGHATAIIDCVWSPYLISLFTDDDRIVAAKIIAAPDRHTPKSDGDVRTVVQGDLTPADSRQLMELLPRLLLNYSRYSLLRLSGQGQPPSIETTEIYRFLASRIRPEGGELS